MNMFNLYKSFLLSNASYFELWKKEGRIHSAKYLKNLFYGLTKSLNPDIFIEIGAHDAAASMRIKNLIPNCRCVAFEANPYNFQHFFDKNSQIYNQKIEYINAAISNSDDFVDFNILKEFDGKDLCKISGRSSISLRTDKRYDYEVKRVKSYTLDNFFNKIQNETISVWIDVEGAVKNVFLGSGKLFNNIKLIIVEVEEKKYWEDQFLADDVIQYLINLDFIPVQRDYEYRDQYNIIFCKNDFFNNFSIAENLSYYSIQNELLRERERTQVPTNPNNGKI